MTKKLINIFQNQAKKIIDKDPFKAVSGFKQFHPYIQISAAALFLVVGTKFDERIIHNWNLKHNSPTAIAYVQKDSIGYDEFNAQLPAYLQNLNIPPSEELFSE